MGNPPKPAELKILQGNPGQHKIRTNDALAPLDYGYIEPPHELGIDGKRFWDSVFGAGELWISIKTDTQLVLMIAEAYDRRAKLMEMFWQNPADRPTNMSLVEIEKQIISGLSLLGFSPADRTRLGLVSAKTKSKLEELLAKKNAK